MTTFWTKCGLWYIPDAASVAYAEAMSMHAGLVLAQHDSVVRRSALAVLGQRVLDAGEALGDAGVVRGVGDVLRAVLELEHQPVVAGVQRPLQRLGDVAGAAAARPRRW